MTAEMTTAAYRRLTGGFTLSGMGLHSGRECVLRVEPCDELIMAADGQEGRRIADLSLRGSGRGSDYIFPNGSSVRTCEHVLAALVGMGVWGARLSVEGGEMPAVDGCAKTVAEMVREHSEPCADGPEPLCLSVPVVVGGGARFVAAFPSPEFRVTCAVKYDSDVIGAQMTDFCGGAEEFASEIAGARTFAMASEIEMLRAHGMALGGSLENAILVHSDRAEAAGGLRWPDEFSRHKTLDVIGDTAALGRPIRAHIVAVRAGHELHLRLVERLRNLSLLS